MTAYTEDSLGRTRFSKPRQQLLNTLLASGLLRDDGCGILVNGDGWTIEPERTVHIWALTDTGQSAADAEPLADHELDALLGWTAREMAREVERRRCARLDALKWASHLGVLARFHVEAASGAGPALDLIAREQRSRSLRTWDGLADNDREALANHVAKMLSGAFTDDQHGEHGLARKLCEAATKHHGGWP